MLIHRLRGAVVFAVFLLAVSAALASDALEESGPGGTVPQILYAHTSLNVREGPGLRFKVIRQLTRGERLVIENVDNGWGQVGVGEARSGFVLLRLLKREPLRPMEIVRWEWKPSPNTGRSGVTAWVVELRNNTEQPADSVVVEFRTFDRSGNLLGTDLLRLRTIAPGSIKGAKSYAGYSGREIEGEIRVLTAEGELAKERKKKSPAAGGGGSRGGPPTKADKD